MQHPQLVGCFEKPSEEPEGTHHSQKGLQGKESLGIETCTGRAAWSLCGHPCTGEAVSLHHGSRGVCTNASMESNLECGYGDSTGSPTEEGICEDALVVHSWVKKHAGNSPVFLWGHSLGTGVTSKITRKLCEEGNCPAGVVLEAPFTSTREECSGHPFAQPWRYFPWFDWFFTDGLEANNIYFESDKHVAAITCPLLILHAEDDFIVPFRLGKKLYEIAKETRPKGAPPVHFIGYDRSHGYGHKYICNSPALPQVIREFVEGLPQKV
ncbi:Protein abhd12b [Branchiostoma belcheri]|nr:Protein abhd12b [Branchiostoma belcheri]